MSLQACLEERNCQLVGDVYAVTPQNCGLELMTQKILTLGSGKRSKPAEG